MFNSVSLSVCLCLCLLSDYCHCVIMICMYISNDLLPSVMSDVRRVGVAKLLGVHLTQNLSFS